MNREGDRLAEIIPGSRQICGADSPESKERTFEDFASGRLRVLITKPKIGAWGLNWQHCGHHTFFPSHSFEQYYQAVRRSLRFGRTDPVRVDIVTTKGEEGVTANLPKKQRKADEMFSALVREMNHSATVSNANRHTAPMEVPAWL